LSDVTKIGREADFGSPETAKLLPKLDVKRTLENLSDFDEVDGVEVPRMKLLLILAWFY
jgi:hypothetical protein